MLERFPPAVAKKVVRPNNVAIQRTPKADLRKAGLSAFSWPISPSGISTSSVAGASFGHLPLWTALFSFP